MAPLIQFPKIQKVSTGIKCGDVCEGKGSSHFTKEASSDGYYARRCGTQLAILLGFTI
jgi:hypothetical protein